MATMKRSSSSEDASDHNAKRTMARKVIILPTVRRQGGENFAIDENDYLRLGEILLTSGDATDYKTQYDLSNVYESGMVEVQKDSDELQVCKLTWNFFSPKLPNGMGKLLGLKELYVDFDFLTSRRSISLPPSIMWLKSLEVLCLWRADIRELPEEIGDLVKLRQLELDESRVEALPPSIGRLKNLEALSLYRTWLRELPEEIGDLSSLHELDLERTEITSLPPSVGRLKNLEILDMSNTNILHLPEAVGELVSLNKMSLENSKISSIPSSIQGLQNLECLDLSGTKNLVAKLPTEIWELRKLEQLRLWSSSAKSFAVGNLHNLQDAYLRSHDIKASPNSFARLKRLRFLHVEDDLRMEGKNRTQFLLTIVRHCQSLGHLRTEGYEDTHAEGFCKISFALACNRARSRMRFTTLEGNDYIALTPELWPRLLESSTDIFAPYQSLPPAFQYSMSCYNFLPKKPDAAYLLLTEGIESFIGLLIERSRKSSL